MAYAHNPSTLGGLGRLITWGQEFETSLANMAKLISTKNTKITWMWWCEPVIPATWEAKSWELLELRKQRLQWAEIVPLLSSLGCRVRLCLNKKIKKLTLNVNGPNAPIKRHRQANWTKSQDPTVCCIQEIHLTCKDSHRFKIKDRRRSIKQMESKNKQG